MSLDIAIMLEPASLRTMLRRLPYDTVGNIAFALLRADTQGEDCFLVSEAGIDPDVKIIVLRQSELDEKYDYNKPALSGGWFRIVRKIDGQTEQQDDENPSVAG